MNPPRKWTVLQRNTILKVKPVLGTLPERFKITREIIGDLLKNMPRLPERPPEFQTKGCYNLDRKEKLDAVHPAGFLWPEERKLIHWLVAEQNEVFAWDDTERGNSRRSFSHQLKYLQWPISHG